MMTQYFPIIVEQESNGTVSAWVAGLPGVYASGDRDGREAGHSPCTRSPPCRIGHARREPTECRSRVDYRQRRVRALKSTRASRTAHSTSSRMWRGGRVDVDRQRCQR